MGFPSSAWNRQTITPDGLVVASVSDNTVWLEWTPILYTEHDGGYEVFSESVSTGTPTSAGYTLTKSASTFPVTGLAPGESFDLSVRTFTRPHSFSDAWPQQNTVISELTPPVMAMTSSNGCTEPQITVSGGGPYALTATVHDSWLWSTGETSQSIEVNPGAPHWPSWYWVKTTDAGGCTDAAVALGPHDLSFADDIESGYTFYWSDSVPGFDL